VLFPLSCLQLDRSENLHWRQSLPLVDAIDSTRQERGYLLRTGGPSAHPSGVDAFVLVRKVNTRPINPQWSTPVKPPGPPPPEGFTLLVSLHSTARWLR
jgi:hypothetical protein